MLSKNKKWLLRFCFDHSGSYALYSVLCKLKKKKGKVTIQNHGRARLRKDIEGKDNLIRIGVNATVHDAFIKIHGNNNTLTIGDNCVFGRGCSFWIEGDGCNITIGANSTFTRNCHINAQENNRAISIGMDCMFSNQVTVRTSDSHKILYIDTGLRINDAKDVTIGSHVWVATQSTVMKGVTIGDGAIIGANSIVTKDVTKNTMAVGMPAKVVKTGCTWSRESLF